MGGEEYLSERIAARLKGKVYKMRFMDLMEEYKQKVGVTEKEDARDM